MVWDLQTLERLNAIEENRQKAKKEAAAVTAVFDLLEIVERSGFDLSPCRMCGNVVVCIPDGLPYCTDCCKDEG